MSDRLVLRMTTPEALQEMAEGGPRPVVKVGGDVDLYPDCPHCHAQEG